MRNLPWSLSQPAILSHIAPLVPPIVNSELPQQGGTANRGLLFLEFATEQDASVALHSLKDLKISEKRIDVYECTGQISIAKRRPKQERVFLEDESHQYSDANFP